MAETIRNVVQTALVLVVGVVAALSYNLTTRIDGLYEAIGEMRGEIGEIRGEIGKTRADSNEAIGGLRGEIGKMRADFAEAIGVLRGEIGGLRGEIGKMRADFAEAIGGLRGEIGEMRGDIRRLESNVELLKRDVAGIKERLSRTDREFRELSERVFDAETDPVMLLGRHGVEASGRFVAAVIRGDFFVFPRTEEAAGALTSRGWVRAEITPTIAGYHKP